MLASCYRESPALAVAHSVRTITFPAIGCGIYGYPVAEAVSIALKTVADFLTRDTLLAQVTFACFGHDTSAALAAAHCTIDGL